jgi:hypothetical protein
MPFGGAGWWASEPILAEWPAFAISQSRFGTYMAGKSICVVRPQPTGPGDEALQRAMR